VIKFEIEFGLPTKFCFNWPSGFRDFTDDNRYQVITIPKVSFKPDLNNNQLSNIRKKTI